MRRSCLTASTDEFITTITQHYHYDIVFVLSFYKIFMIFSEWDKLNARVRTTITIKFIYLVNNTTNYIFTTIFTFIILWHFVFSDIKWISLFIKWFLVLQILSAYMNVITKHIIKRQIIKAFNDMIAADNEMSSDEESSFQDFSNDEDIASVTTRSNPMTLSFIMNTMKNSMINQNSLNVSFWIVINKSQNFTDIDHSLIITVIDLSIEQIEQNIVNISVNTAAEKRIDESTISIKAKVIRRKNLLRERMNVSKIIEDITSLKKFRLQDLTEKIRKQFEKEVLNKLKSSQEEKDKNIIINEKNYHVECTIKYLHSCARFILNNLTANLIISESSQKLTKVVTNKKLIKIFCEIIKNFASNKIWKKDHHKIVAENSAFVLLLNKKSVNDLTQENSSITRDIFYHYTNVFESRITQNKIWFTENLSTSKKRFQRVQETAKIHHAWKIQSRKNYQNECRIYLEKRIEWKYNLVD